MYAKCILCVYCLKIPSPFHVLMFLFNHYNTALPKTTTIEQSFKQAFLRVFQILLCVQTVPAPLVLPAQLGRHAQLVPWQLLKTIKLERRDEVHQTP